jgi:BlaI family penicillinase repressor
MTEKKLPDAELEVLACLWKQGGEGTARQIRETLEPYRPMAHGSVMTLLKRLEEKGLVTRRKGSVGKAFIFQAARKPGPTYRRLVRDLLDRVFGGNGLALVHSLFETRPPTPEEIDDLQQMLDELRARAMESSDADSSEKGGEP